MYWGSLYNTYWRVASKKKNSNFTMSVDVFLLINLHRNTALPARLPSSGRAPRTSCVIPEPRLPKLHSCFPTDLDSIRLPSSVLTARSACCITPPLSPRVLFPSETNLNLRTLWSPPSVPTGTVLKLGGSMPISRLKPPVRLRFCQRSSTPTFLLVSILTETSPLVTNPVSTRWSPPGLLIGVVLKLSGSVSVALVVGSCCRF